MIKRIVKPNQDLAYHQFLNSASRDYYISENIYKALIPEKSENLNVLIYNCGLGYIVFKFADFLKKDKNNHIYGCDYIEDVLDLTWQKIAKKKTDNITLFFMPDRARVELPGWLPKWNHIFFNMSLSLNENPIILLNSLRPFLAENAQVHALEWNPGKTDEKLEKLYPSENRLAPAVTQQILTSAGFTITKTINPDKFYYVLSAK